MRGAVVQSNAFLSSWAAASPRALPKRCIGSNFSTTFAQHRSCAPTAGLQLFSRRLRAARNTPILLLLSLLLAALLYGCGSSSSHRGAAKGASAAHGPAGDPSVSLSPLPAALPHPVKATLILDFVPNAVHAGIYRAIAEGLYRREDIELKVIEPSETQDTLSLIDAGKADFGLADGSDLATLISKGGDAQAIMAIAQRPLGGLISRASEHLSSPLQLQGKTVGITGVPSDSAVLDTEVRAAGGDPSRVHVVTVGFNGAQALRAGKIAAFTGFWPADGVQLQVTGEPVKSFKLDDWGGPPYPGLVAFSNRRLIDSDPALVRDFVGATVRGYQLTLRNPQASLHDLLAINPEVQANVAKASLAAYLPLFTEAGKAPFGMLRPSHVNALSSWMVGHDLIAAPIAFGRYGTNRFLPQGG
jgi:putative hydroxymethylpyrimidine transport system substrate-binding protein